MPTPQARAHRLFSELIDASLAERARRLAGVAESEVLHEVRALFQALDGDPGFLETSCHSLLADAATLLEKLASGQRRPELPDGQLIGDFEVLAEIGRGALASVYLARERSLGRHVALKVAAGEVGDEARLMAQLDHDHIVKVFSESACPHEEHGRLRLLAMQFIPGVPLDRILARLKARRELGFLGALDEAWAVAPKADDRVDLHTMHERQCFAMLAEDEIVIGLGIQLARALAYAHERGVLHLDIKPSNILISLSGRPFLMDFNVSLRRADLSGGERSIIGGTLNYMAPEQAARVMKAAGDAPPVDERADIYSLGRVLEDLLKTLAPPATERPAHLARLDSIVATCLQADPTARFSTGGALGRALERCHEIKTVMEALPPAGPIVRFSERFPILSLVALALIPQLIGSVFNIAYNYSQIVSHLSPGQHLVFHKLCAVYNLLTYPLTIALFFYWTWALCRQLPGVCSGLVEAEDGDRTRHAALAIPRLIMWLSTFGWLPGIVFFPLGFYLLGAPLPLDYTVHFFVSISLSWIMALSYTYVGLHYWSVRVVYPKLLPRDRPVRETAREELKPLTRASQFFHLAAGAMPLFAAVTLILLHAFLAQATTPLNHFLLVFLILVGLTGFFLAAVGTMQLTRILQALVAK